MLNYQNFWLLKQDTYLNVQVRFFSCLTCIFNSVMRVPRKSGPNRVDLAGVDCTELWHVELGESEPRTPGENGPVATRYLSSE